MNHPSPTRPFPVLAAIVVAAALPAASVPSSFAERQPQPRTQPSAKPKSEPRSKSKPSYAPGPMLRRFLKGSMAGVDEIIFAQRVPGRDHWYVTFGNYSDHSSYAKKQGFKKADGVYWGYGEGGRLCRFNLRTGKVKVLLDDPRGGVRDPQLHYDGKKILFSYRKGGRHTFHLYEINIDGTGLVQLTDGPDDDIEPTYCPDGSIVFCSSRCRRFVNCWFTRVATLYRCDADGSNIRMLSSNNDHDNTPWMLPDGRVLYMRWEYVDRSQVHFHHLWTMNPDGTGQMAYFGNQRGGIAMLDAKPIPGTDKVVASFSPGHGRPEHFGFVTVVDPKGGPDQRIFARNITKHPHWKDPYAFSEDCFLVAHGKGIFVMDGQGKTELIYELPRADRRMQCHEPRPLRSRPREPVIASRTDLAKPTGRLILQNIYEGRNISGLEPGDVKRLLVLAQLPKPVNFSPGMQPLSIGGTFTLAEILGTLPVEPDGSAYMELPALRSIFFVALDKDDKPLKRMHSFLVLQPGETTGCVGCHEHRTRSPHAIPFDRTAMRHRPRRPQPIPDVPTVLDFPRDIQPILDKHCVRCHNPDRCEARVDLTGDKTPMYTMSYWTIRQRNLVTDGRNAPRGNRPPRSTGSATSRLMKLITPSHYDARLSDHEIKMVRLWIETSATYPGTYASLGCGYYPVHLPRAEIKNRCGRCHTREMHDKKRGKYEVLRFGPSTLGRPGPLCNISRPEKSVILRAPLAKDAGGLDLCKEPVFEATDDPLYNNMLAAVRNAKKRLDAGKRFDMPGFRPNQHYIREMQRFGLLPKNLSPDQPLDPYVTDKAYWDSFHYQPPAAGQ